MPTPLETAVTSLLQTQEDLLAAVNTRKVDLDVAVDAAEAAALVSTTAVTTGISNHTATGDPHPQYVLESSVDAVPTSGSNDPVSSDGVFDALATKASAGNNTDITSMSGLTGVVGDPAAIQFGDGSNQTLAPGKMWYNATTGAWNLGMGGGNITQQVGEEFFTYGKASAAISDAIITAVYRTGAVGASGVITFAPTIAGITDSNLILGIATEPIALDAIGRVTTNGIVRGIDTSGAPYGETWVDDDTIWYDPTDGGLSNVMPTAPNLQISLGSIARAHANTGVIQVKLSHANTTAADIAAIINAASSKTTPIDADAFAGIDSADGFSLKKFAWSNIKATLAAYFDTVYLKLTGGVIAGGSRTASGSTLTVSETWNNASVAFPGAVVVDVTNTASAVNSLLMDLKTGGVRKLSVDKDGNLKFGRGDYEGVAILSTGSRYAGVGIGVNGLVKLTVANGGVSSNGVPFSAQWGGFFEIDADNGGTNVVRAYRDAANVWAQRNGTSAQTFRLYNTYTDASNYERGFMRWNSNVLEIGTEAGGTGVGRYSRFVGYNQGQGYAFEFYDPTHQVCSIKLRGLDRSVTINAQHNCLDAPSFRSSSNYSDGVGHIGLGIHFVSGNGAITYCGLAGAAAGVLQVNNGLGRGASYGAALETFEMAAPSAPATDGVRIYAEDNGSGKTRLMALFATGSPVQIAIEP